MRTEVDERRGAFIQAGEWERDYGDSRERNNRGGFWVLGMQ